jgi:GNAT superfamily N-acetyltransferase
LPAAFEDAPKVGATSSWTTESETRAAASAELVRAKTVPALIRAAVDAGWWRPESGDEADAGGQAGPDPKGSTVEIDAAIDAAGWAGLDLAARVAGPSAPSAGHALVGGALRSPAHRAIATGARVGRHVVGLAVSAWDEERSVRQLLALGVAPGWRRQGIAGALLATHIAEVTRRAEPGPLEMLVTTAERDVVEPLARDVRADLARRLLGGAGFRIEQPAGDLARVDPLALRATWPG